MSHTQQASSRWASLFVCAMQAAALLVHGGCGAAPQMAGAHAAQEETLFGQQVQLARDATGAIGVDETGRGELDYPQPTVQGVALERLEGEQFASAAGPALPVMPPLGTPVQDDVALDEQAALPTQAASSTKPRWWFSEVRATEAQLSEAPQASTKSWRTCTAVLAKTLREARAQSIERAEQKLANAAALRKPALGPALDNEADAAAARMVPVFVVEKFSAQPLPSASGGHSARYVGFALVRLEMRTATEAEKNAREPSTD